MATVNIASGVNAQSVIAANPAGTTFQFGSGIYRQQQFVPRAGDVYIGAADGTTTFSGAMLLTFRQSGSFWIATGLPNQTRDDTSNGNFPTTNGGLANICNDLWITSGGSTLWYNPVSSLSNLGSGNCFFDTSSNTLYIVDNPSGKTCEYSVVNQCWDQAAVVGNGITCSNFTVEKYMCATGVGAFSGISNCTLTNMTFRMCHGTGLGSCQSCNITRCRMTQNGFKGFGNICSNTTLTNCEIDNNCYAGYDNGWDGAGTKCECNNLTFRNCYVHNNNATGIWADISSHNWIVDGCYVSNNRLNGIQYELSYGPNAQFTNNTVVGNGLAGIMISNSETCLVANNKVWAGAGTSGIYNGAITVVNDNRVDASTGFVWFGQNNNVNNNQVVFSTADSSQFGSYEIANFPVQPTGGNTFNFDTFYIPSTSRNAFHFEFSDYTWSGLQAHGTYEVNGTAIFAAGPAPPAPPVLNAGVQVVTAGGGTGGGPTPPPPPTLPGVIGGTDSGHGGGIGSGVGTGGNLSTVSTGPAGDPWAPAFVPAFGPASTSSGGTGGTGGVGGGFIVQRNPGGGWVNTGSSALATLLLFYNEIVYYEDATWHQWNGTSWTAIAGDPRVPAESPQGTSLTDATGTIYNAALHAFTLKSVAGQGLEVYIDGVYSSPTSNVVVLLYWNHAVYHENNAGSWFVYDGTTPWAPTARDPRIAESPQGATVTSSMGVLYDVNLTPYALVQSANQGLEISIGGAVDANTSNVVTLLYWNHQVYQQSASSGWWLYNGTTPWVSTTDPRGATGTPPNFFDDFTSLSLIDSRTPSTSGNNWQPVYWYAVDGTPINSTWIVNPFNPATPITALYNAVGGTLTLTMEATPSQYSAAVGSLPYVGAQLTTQPHFRQAIGYFECQVNVPKVPGTMFSFKLMQDQQWPPEIDVVQIACGQNADSSIWQVAKSTLWNSNPANPQPIAQIFSYNNPGNLTLDPSTSLHTYGVLIDATNVTFYWDRVQVGQFALPAGYSGYSFFPVIGVNDGGAWSGPVTQTNLLPFSVSVGYVEVWPAIPFTPATKPTVTNITLASLQVAAGSPSGTLVSQVIVVMSDGSGFGGTLALSGANASNFALAGGTNLVTAGTITQGTNYAVSITASAGSTLTKSFTIAGVAQGALGPGPAASSAFLTADFASAFTYPGGSGQQIVSQRMYGVSTGNAGFTGFAALGNASFQTAAASINPGVWRFSGALPERGDDAYFAINGTVNTNTFANLVNNFNKLDPLGISGIVIGVDVGILASVVGVTSAASYQTAMSNLATYLNNATMPNGKKLPVIGFECQNEPDGRIPQAQLTPYYNAMVTAVRAVNPNFLVFGPTGSFAGAAMPAFQQAVSRLDVIDYHSFLGGYSGAAGPGQSAYQASKGTQDIQDAVGLSASLPQAYFAGAYNIDWNAAAAEQANYIGAVYAAAYLLQSLNGSPVPFWAALWDAYDDGTSGIIQDPNMAIAPAGAFLGQAVRTVFGARYTVTVNSAGLLACACEPAAGHFGLMIVNAGQGAQNGQKIALSHWPVNQNGNGSANVWQLTSSNGNGATSTVAVTAGVTATMNFPDPSITIIYI